MSGNLKSGELPAASCPCVRSAALLRFARPARHRGRLALPDCVKQIFDNRHILIGLGELRLPFKKMNSFVVWYLTMAIYIPHGFVRLYSYHN